jgi:hypothetical protein
MPTSSQTSKTVVKMTSKTSLSCDVLPTNCEQIGPFSLLPVYMLLTMLYRSNQSDCRVLMADTCCTFSPH